MQKDMHFYGVYALARAAGLGLGEAFTVAHSSQFVDDAVDRDMLNNDLGKAVISLMTSHRAIDSENSNDYDQWHVWVPFHFLPGNVGNSFNEKVICRKNSIPAHKILQNALSKHDSPFWPHLIGVTAHVYADTFSHFGFLGISSDWNKADEATININVQSPNILQYINEKFETFKAKFAGVFASLVPVGHGSVETLPDRPYLKWSFKYLTGKHMSEDENRNNQDSFLEGCKCLYEFFCDYVNISGRGDRNKRKPWGDIKSDIKTIIDTEGMLSERIDLWKDKIRANVFCASEPADLSLNYDENIWKIGNLSPTYQYKDDILHFINAARTHKNYVLYELLPQLDLVIT
ncbi:DUF6765 family protein [Candidatus Magnetomonas plexicatena]|uniref:DUF6765 family protein n=1 Tax=Candidatus Magnetomonas plexicatena TaxID=2552947 RepID=UPI001C7408E8|nr:hypothetical protein E2O03_007075 [Nitrospirales bacterium LBB_01]